MSNKYNFEIITEGKMLDTMYDTHAWIHAIVFRDKREHHGDPDAFNDYCVSEPADPLCYDDLAEFKAADDKRHEMRKQWERDVLDTLGIKVGHVTTTDTECFTAIEITEAES